MTLDLDTAVNQARALEQAAKQSEVYRVPFLSTAEKTDAALARAPPSVDTTLASSRTSSKPGNCYNCGYPRHHNDNRSLCPALKSKCKKCGKMGHYARVCKSGEYRCGGIASGRTLSAGCSVSSSIVGIQLNGVRQDALVDTGSSENFLSAQLASELRLPCVPIDLCVRMACSNLSQNITQSCTADVQIDERTFSSVQFLIMNTPCQSVILGIPFIKLFKSVTIRNDCKKRFEFSSYADVTKPMNVPPARLFHNLSNDCRPVAAKQRRFHPDDEIFLQNQVEEMLSNDIIERSFSPWRAQVVIVNDGIHKKRMVVDFSQTINRFTLLDAYPLPNIEDLVNKVAKFKYFSVIDLSNAYYQIEIPPGDRPYTAFQAGHDLYQFKRIPMGVTNAVSAFQRIMNSFIRENSLVSTFAYLDDLLVCGRSKDEHDANLHRFLSAASQCNLIINSVKSKYTLTEVKWLGYLISEGKIRPDPARLEPLVKLRVPDSRKSLGRVIGLFAYYAKWIPKYSEKIQPLLSVKSFPLNNSAISAFDSIREEIIQSLKVPINHSMSFTVECDASEAAVGAVLLQGGMPVAFHSRTLSKSERAYPIVEKEALSIVEALRKWNYLLAAKHFTIITDQKSVSFMFDARHSTKIKNDKILRWRLELSAFSFDIIYRPGEENVA
ncbi:MAG: reverse transcriptase domain-containing protein, partial [Promethearchaeota archaeon]